VGSAVYTALSPGHLFSSSHPGANPTAGLSLPGVAAAIPKGFNPVETPQVAAEDVAFSSEVSRLASMTPSHQAEEPVTRVYAAAVTPEPAATPPAAILEPPPIFTTYEVQPGDTVSSIAAQFGLRTDSIVWNNVDLSDKDFLAVGQLLRIPAMDGIIHEVRLGETLGDIAARYDADLNAITTFTSNGITTPDDIQEKQLVFVPGGTMPAPTPAPVAVEPAEPAGGGVAGEPAAPAPAPAGARPASSEGLIWPVTGPISSYMGPSHPLGIDIDQYATPNAPIYAATSGVVTFAGGDPCCSYGLHVILMSPGGIETLYAHMSSINVVEGQQVAQGDVLGYVGCTGYCTGNHLHFEVIDNGVRVDPLTYLP
jgi:murein DD-endopeptidase MepM/ murein hydrolase activator NlpD